MAKHFKEKGNQKLYFDYFEKSIFFCNNPSYQLDSSFGYVRELIKLKENEKSELFTTEQVNSRIIVIGKFLERLYQGSFELFNFLSDYFKKQNEEEQKEGMKIFFSKDL